LQSATFEVDVVVCGRESISLMDSSSVRLSFPRSSNTSEVLTKDQISAWFIFTNLDAPECAETLTYTLEDPASNPVSSSVYELAANNSLVVNSTESLAPELVFMRVTTLGSVSLTKEIWIEVCGN